MSIACILFCLLIDKDELGALICLLKIELADDIPIGKDVIDCFFGAAGGEVVKLFLDFITRVDVSSRSILLGD